MLSCIPLGRAELAEVLHKVLRERSHVFGVLPHLSLTQQFAVYDRSAGMHAMLRSMLHEPSCHTLHVKVRYHSRSWHGTCMSSMVLMF